MQRIDRGWWLIGMMSDGIKESLQGTCDTDSTCLYLANAKPNMTIKTKKLKHLLTLFGSDM